MPIARIVTRNPESTENLAAYLRARGYEVLYGNPDTPQPQTEDLTISVEACSTRAEALTRAHEIAARSSCDVFVGEGVVDRLALRQSSQTAAERAAGPAVATKAVPEPARTAGRPHLYRPDLPDAFKDARAARANPLRQVLNSQVLGSVGASMRRHIYRGWLKTGERFRLVGRSASEKWEELARWGQGRAANFAKWQQDRRRAIVAARQQAQRVKAQNEIAKRRSAPESRARHYQRDWRLLFTGAAVAALLLVFVVALFMAHSRANSPSKQVSGGTPKVATGARTAVRTDDARPPSIKTEAVSLPALSEKTSAKVVDQKPSAAKVADKPRHRSLHQSASPEPEVTVRHFNRPAPPTADKTRAGVRRYSDLN